MGRKGCMDLPSGSCRLKGGWALEGRRFRIRALAYAARRLPVDPVLMLMLFCKSRVDPEGQKGHVR
eukprot:359188-Chlamydomonas_euryale.AAC.18